VQAPPAVPPPVEGLKTKVGIIIESRAYIVNKNKVAVFSKINFPEMGNHLAGKTAPAAAYANSNTIQ
jgi:hypothetical protein